MEIEDYIQTLQPFISANQNRSLMAKFIENEMIEALFIINPLGAPSGFLAGSIKNIGHQLAKNASLTRVNDTFIAFIPKVKFSQKVGKLRPISLCNVIYKLVAKVLANRLKGILSTIISLTQSAFVSSRFRTDNILIAYEALHSLTNKCHGSHRFIAIKLDMSKIYDRVKREFLKAVMIQMGFNFQWIKLVMECVTIVSYSLLINGEPQPNFKPTTGIRQHDSLSPYLFIMC